MSLLQKLRKTAYWVLDFLKGSPVRKHYKHISSILDHPESTFAKQETATNLDKLLKHAIANIPYYKNLKPNASLQDFPITNKNILRDNSDDFFWPEAQKQKLQKFSTSGSTGTPFTIYKSKDKRNRNVADVFYFADKTGYELGSTLYYFRHWDAKLKKSKLLSFIQNIVPFEVARPSDDYIASFLENLKKDTSKKAFIGYPSAYNTVINYLQRHNSEPANYNIHSIIAIAETLTKEVKEQTEYYFNCPVVSRYSNMENGIIAQQIPGKGTHFYINTASYVVEVLDQETNIPVFGKPGKIVVTDLYNYTTPFIRYDTGDIGVLEKDEEKGLVWLARVDGRKMDVLLNTKGEILSSYMSFNVLHYPHILQSQMIQEGPKEYKFKLNIVEGFNSEEIIKKEYLEILGADANITFEYVDEIPLLQSGKRKLMVNNYIKYLEEQRKKT